MNYIKNFKDEFKGFQSTSLLWKASAVYNLEQFCPESTSIQFTQEAKPKRLRLGKWVEHFVTFQLKHQNDIKILEENLQIKDQKITIGELDLLFLQGEQPIHLEIIYKFYLHDPKQDNANPLNNWVGPNQSDALIYKLNKLKNKQLPLLFNSKTKDALKIYSFDINSIKQKVCFKAQLFLPFENQNMDIAPLNQDCVVGWYLSFEKINELKNYQFYIPEKLEWLTLPKLEVNWLNFEGANYEIKIQIENKRSPLCWIKNDKNQLQKCFITWW